MRYTFNFTSLERNGVINDFSSPPHTHTHTHTVKTHSPNQRKDLALVFSNDVITVDLSSVEGKKIAIIF